MGDGRPTYLGQTGDKDSRQLLPYYEFLPLGTAGYLNSGEINFCGCIKDIFILIVFLCL
jgi:hypothetical protein